MSHPSIKATSDVGRGAAGNGRALPLGGRGGAQTLPIRGGSSPSMGRGGHQSSSARPTGYGDDEFTDPKSQIYNPQPEAPSAAVAAKEERDRPNAGPLVFEDLGDDIPLPVRPGFGTSGIRINLRTNHFALSLDLEKTMHRYSIMISDPEIPIGRKRRQFFSVIFNEIPEFQAMRNRVATDYADTMITAGELELGPLHTKEYRLPYHELGELPRSSTKASRVVISLAGVVPTSETSRYLESIPGDSTDLEHRLATLQALNIVVNATPNEDPTVWQASRNVFAQFPRNDNPTNMKVYEKMDLAGGLIGVRAYYSSTKTSTARILLNLHGQCSPFYPELSLLVLMKTFLGKCDDPLALENFIQRLRVRFKYIKDEKNQPYETFKNIQGFSHKKDPQGSPNSRGNADQDHGTSNTIKFHCAKYSRVMTVTEYFSKEHGIELKYPKAPVVNFGSDARPVWIPAELGVVEPGQPYRGKLNDEQTSNMLLIAARGPAENARRLVGAGAQVIGIHANNPILSAFGISISTKMIVVPARVLQPPTILYGDGKTIIPRDASWNLTGTKFYAPGTLKNWSYLRCGRSIFTHQHLQALRNQIKECGLGNTAPMPADDYHAELGIGADEKTDKALHGVMQKAKKDGVKFLFVILDTEAKAIHARLKFLADVVIGIQHTVLLSSSVRLQCNKTNRGAQYFANVMQKVNMKIGGINHILAPKGNPLEFLITSTMLVGIDVSHPTYTSMRKAPSVVGLVASVDDKFAQWLGTTRLQEGRVEMVASIGELMSERLRVYGERHQRYPENIVIYRDGVSEGQFKTVLKEEVSAIEAICAKKYANKGQDPPKLVVIICGKRHRVRFYPMHQKDADLKHNCNPKSGTVVDRGVTSEKYHDFFIQPHAALTGTAKPCHCTVIRDDIKIGPDVIQKVTHNLSYLYGRATKAVSLCPPAYYADLMCERGNEYLNKHLNKRWPPGTEFNFNTSPWIANVNKELQDTMFYV